MVIVMKKPLHGVGINDASYQVRARANNNIFKCPFYKTWSDMIRRCYDKKYHLRQPTYAGCSICDEWISFMSFRSWMIKQDWKGNQLDKDIILTGNKVYSPDFCAFVSKDTNVFPQDSAAIRGKWPVGVSFHKKAGKFMAECGNPITKKREYLGLFLTPEEAHLAWRKRKHELACQLADIQSDARVADSLRIMYLQ
jgi:hypothetical protein